MSKNKNLQQPWLQTRVGGNYVLLVGGRFEDGLTLEKSPNADILFASHYHTSAYFHRMLSEGKVVKTGNIDLYAFSGNFDLSIYKENQFDSVIIGEVPRELDYAALLSGIQRVLKPSGKFIWTEVIPSYPTFPVKEGYGFIERFIQIQKYFKRRETKFLTDDKIGYVGWNKESSEYSKDLVYKLAVKIGIEESERYFRHQEKAVQALKEENEQLRYYLNAFLEDHSKLLEAYETESTFYNRMRKSLYKETVSELSGDIIKKAEKAADTSSVSIASSTVPVKGSRPDQRMLKLTPAPSRKEQQKNIDYFLAACGTGMYRGVIVMYTNEEFIKDKSGTRVSQLAQAFSSLGWGVFFIYKGEKESKHYPVYAGGNVFQIEEKEALDMLFPRLLQHTFDGSMPKVVANTAASTHGAKWLNQFAVRGWKTYYLWDKPAKEQWKAEDSFLLHQSMKTVTSSEEKAETLKKKGISQPVVLSDGIDSSYFQHPRNKVKSEELVIGCVEGNKERIDWEFLLDLTRKNKNVTIHTVSSDRPQHVKQEKRIKWYRPREERDLVNLAARWSLVGAFYEDMVQNDLFTAFLLSLGLPVLGNFQESAEVFPRGMFLNLEEDIEKQMKEARKQEFPYSTWHQRIQSNSWEAKAEQLAGLQVQNPFQPVVVQ
ncbi:hypothetical protein ACFPU1_01575 [Thalassorhabdus alkalitolerans]|uniref:Methyltransferase domain-containing protein n=1 Tax=Thalassorhabdus alkalitolerans TaxID=2282697 RepID=A0ABW0YM84_9BACI